MPTRRRSSRRKSSRKRKTQRKPSFRKFRAQDTSAPSSPSLNRQLVPHHSQQDSSSEKISWDVASDTESQHATARREPAFSSRRSEPAFSSRRSNMGGSNVVRLLQTRNEDLQAALEKLQEQEDELRRQLSHVSATDIEEAVQEEMDVDTLSQEIDGMQIEPEATTSSQPHRKLKPKSPELRLLAATIAQKRRMQRSHPYIRLKRTKD